MVDILRTRYLPFIFFFLLLIFQYICRLAVQYFADSLQRRETDCLSFSGLKDRKVGGGDIYLLRQFAQRYFSARHHDVKVYYNCHNFIFSV